MEAVVISSVGLSISITKPFFYQKKHIAKSFTLKLSQLSSTKDLISLSSRPWPVGGESLMSVTRGQCDARPSCKASPPIGWYQIILLGDRGTCVLTACPGLHSTAGRLGFELTTYWSQVQHPTTTPTSHTTTVPVTTINKLCGKPPHYAPAPCKLTFDLESDV